MHYTLRHLDAIEERVPGLAGRVDRSRIAAVGHSMGGRTVGVMMGSPGRDKDLADYASRRWRILGSTSFDRMQRPALVVTVDNDWHEAFSHRPDLRTGPYRLSPGRKSLLWLYEAGHGFGGTPATT